MSLPRTLLVVAASFSLGSLGCADAKRPAQPSMASPAPVAPARPPGPRGPGGPGRLGRRLYDPQTVETVQGQVMRLDQVASRRGFSEGVQVVLQRSDGSLLSVHLGPSWFLAERKLALAPGDQLEVLGSRVMGDGEAQLIAQKVTKGADALVLRDSAGIPLWGRNAGPGVGPGSGRPCMAPYDGPAAALSDAEQRALRDALDDEYRAWATYEQVLLDLGEQRPFTHIRDAEARHIDALRVTLQRYGLEVPANPWPGRVPRFASVREACQAALGVEAENVALYDRLKKSTTRQDLLQVLENLQRASQERHAPAFQRCAAGRLGPGPRW